MRNKKRLVFMIIAAALMIFAAKGFFTAESKKDLALRDQKIHELNKLIKDTQRSGTNVVDKMNQRSVVVARVKLNPGEKITANDLNFKKINSALVTDDHFKSINDISGKILSKSVSPNQPILKTMLVEMEFKDFHLPIKMRAVSVPTGYILGIAYYHKIGSKVDILSTLKSDDNKLPIIVQNATILAIDNENSTTQTSNKTTNTPRKAMGNKSITFEIPASKMREFVTAIVTGKIQIVSRSKADKEIIQTIKVSKKQEYIAPPVSLREIQDTSLGELPEPIIPDMEPAVRKVEMIQANVKSEIEFNN